MTGLSRIKIALLFTGDLLALYASLFFVLWFRYGDAAGARFRLDHGTPFSILFAAWLFVFFLAGLYDVRRLRNGLEFFRLLLWALGVNAVIGLAFFYLLPFFGITPKTNLFLFLLVFGALEILWRRYFNRAAASLVPAGRVLLVGKSAAAEEIRGFLERNPQFNYEIMAWMPESELATGDRQARRDFIRQKGITLIVLPRHFKKDPGLSRAFFELLDLGVEIQDLPEFYELVFRKVPLTEIDEEWFLEHIANQSGLFEKFKRWVDFTAALLLQVLFLPAEVLIFLFVRLTSPGPAIYRQTRVGRFGKPFTLYKFRTMRQDAELSGPQWAAQNDRRITPFGRLLRFSHLDELPQLWNIIRGDLAFVGPRPERPEFTQKLRTEVPYYEIRTIVPPGLTGWAQIHYPADRTVEDVRRKLEYDIYYLKNRSPVLDLAILMKTIKLFFVPPR